MQQAEKKAKQKKIQEEKFATENIVWIDELPDDVSATGKIFVTGKWPDYTQKSFYLSWWQK